MIYFIAYVRERVSIHNVLLTIYDLLKWDFRLGKTRVFLPTYSRGIWIIDAGSFSYIILGYFIRNLFRNSRKFPLFRTVTLFSSTINVFNTFSKKKNQRGQMLQPDLLRVPMISIRIILAASKKPDIICTTGGPLL